MNNRIERTNDDIRYVLSVIENYGKGKRLIKELGARYAKLNHMYEAEAQQTKPLLARDTDEKKGLEEF